MIVEGGCRLQPPFFIAGFSETLTQMQIQPQSDRLMRRLTFF